MRPNPGSPSRRARTAALRLRFAGVLGSRTNRGAMLLPVAEAPEALDRIACLVGDTRRREDHIFSKRVAAVRLSCCRARFPMRLAHSLRANKDGDHFRRVSPTNPGKAPHKGTASSRVEADCSKERLRSRLNRSGACGTVVEFVECCGLRRKTRTRTAKWQRDKLQKEKQLPYPSRAKREKGVAQLLVLPAWFAFFE